jgi:uncharacterized membrane protein
VPAPRGIIILAAVAGVSVALNLFLIGGMLGHQFRGMPPAQDIEQRFNTMLDKLPAADQPVAHEALDRHMDDLVKKWRAFTQSQQHANELLRATPYDIDQIQAAFDQSNANSTEFRKAIQDAQLDIRSKISSEGAQQLHGPGGPPPGAAGGPRRGPGPRPMPGQDNAHGAPPQ